MMFTSVLILVALLINVVLLVGGSHHVRVEGGGDEGDRYNYYHHHYRLQHKHQQLTVYKRYKHTHSYKYYKQLHNHNHLHHLYQNDETKSKLEVGDDDYFNTGTTTTATTTSFSSLDIINNTDSNNNIVNENNDNNNNNNPEIYLYGGVIKSYEYYVPILIGTPPQMFTVQIDTGSTALAIPGLNCFLYKNANSKTACQCDGDAIDGLYGDSSTREQIKCGDTVNCTRGCTNSNLFGDQCSFKLNYQDGSFIGGTLLNDYVNFAGYTVHAKFGNIQLESLSFSQSTCPVQESNVKKVRDGIMGLAYQKLDPNNGDDIFSKIVNHYQIHNSFSMCFGKQQGGILVVGGIDPRYNTTEMKYTPISEEKYYSINVTGISINDHIIPNMVFENYSIVDSGTTILYLSQSIFKVFTDYLLDNYPTLPGFGGSNLIFWDQDGNCINLSPSDLLKYPNISLIVLDQDGNPFPLTIGPNQYLLNMDGYYCFGIGKFPYSKFSILIGDIFLQSFNVHYNRNDKSIGFAPVDLNQCTPSTELNYQVSIKSGDRQLTKPFATFNQPLVVAVELPPPPPPHPHSPHPTQHHQSSTIMTSASITTSTTTTTTISPLHWIPGGGGNSDGGEGRGGGPPPPPPHYYGNKQIQGIMVVFEIVNGDAQFLPVGQKSLIRNITDSNGLVAAHVQSLSGGLIIIKCFIFDSVSSNTIYFTLHSPPHIWRFMRIFIGIVVVAFLIFILSIIFKFRKRFVSCFCIIVLKRSQQHQHQKYIKLNNIKIVNSNLDIDKSINNTDNIIILDHEIL